VGAPLPAVSYSGVHQGCKLTVVCNGKDPVSGVDSVGTVCAALTTMAAVQAVKPDLVINAGTAGGFKVCACALQLNARRALTPLPQKRET